MDRSRDRPIGRTAKSRVRNAFASAIIGRGRSVPRQQPPADALLRHPLVPDPTAPMSGSAGPHEARARNAALLCEVRELLKTPDFNPVMQQRIDEIFAEIRRIEKQLGSLAKPEAATEPLPAPIKATTPSTAPEKARTEVSGRGPVPLEAPKPAWRSWKGLSVPIAIAALAMGQLIIAGALFWPQGETEPARAPAASEALPPPTPAAALIAPEVVAPAAAEEIAAAGPPAEPAAAAGTIYLRMSAGLGRQQRQRIEAVLAKAGYGTVIAQELPFSVSRSRVGYFREADRASAEALIAALRGTLDGLELRDYRALVKAPEPRRLDLWVGG